MEPKSEHQHLPEIIDGFASEGIIQFFFEDTEKGFNIYILDELNRVEVYLNCQGCIDELVCDVSRFYASSHERFTYGSGSVNFNLPQFYQIIRENEVEKVIPFNSNSISPLSAPTVPLTKKDILLSNTF
ncbi:adenylate cyclase [Leminorella grimontii]|nr:adenylate cyclase [Leminorella grimontii]